MDQGLLSEFPSRSLIRVKTLTSIGFYSYYVTSEKDQLIFKLFESHTIELDPKKNFE